MKLRFVFLIVGAIFFSVSSNAQEPYVRIAKIVVDPAQIENYKTGTFNMVKSLELVDVVPIIFKTKE